MALSWIGATVAERARLGPSYRSPPPRDPSLPPRAGLADPTVASGAPDARAPADARGPCARSGVDLMGAEASLALVYRRRARRQSVPSCRLVSPRRFLPAF